MATSSIEWTEQTWNPVVGCTKVSPGCKACYAEKMAARLKAMALADIAAGRDPGRKRHYIDVIDDKGRWNGKLTEVPEALRDPCTWKKPRHVFVNSMSDLFHRSLNKEFILQVLTVMAIEHRHTFQVLTKRTDRLSKLLNRWRPDDVYAHWHTFSDRAAEVQAWPLRNVWFGVSVESYDHIERIEALRATPAAVRFLSVEPMLTPVVAYDGPSLEGIHWVIFGCESNGPKVGRLGIGGELGTEELWLATLRHSIEVCQAAGVDVFVKQIPLKGRVSHDPAEWPEDLRVRDFPRTEASRAK